jgi:CRISPR-associated protein Csh2
MVENRAELVFVYDIKDANPNGDPLDENKPRIDEETGINIVTDVRLKRTVRDYLMNFKGEEIFIKEKRKDDGKLETKEDRLDDLNVSTPEDLAEKCIDIRLFGATVAIKDKSIQFTGPVQFRFGRSLHKVAPVLVKGTTVMPSKEAKGQGTFTETYILPYSLICFHGIINENAAQYTKLTEDDVQMLMHGLWDGTKNLISRSKAGQIPRLLLKVNYRKGSYHIGDLDKMITIKSDKSDEEIRSISDVVFDVTELIDALNKNKDKIESIDLRVDDRVAADFSNMSGDIPMNEI